MNKTIFLERLQNERDTFELLLNRVGFSRQLTMRNTSNGLSIKDMLADVLTREQFMADRLNEIVYGESYTPCQTQKALDAFEAGYGFPDYESPLVNKEKRDHMVIHKHKNIGLDDIIAQELAAYHNILAVFEKLTHEQCLDHDVFHRVGEQTYRPYRRMSLEIRRWLKSLEAESK